MWPTDAVKMIRGQGMPSYRHHDYGNMYIQFTVKFPEKNWTQDPAAFDALRKILPAPSLVNVPPGDSVSDPVELEDPDGSSKGFPADGEPMEEDDEHPQAERVQCASQ